MNTVDEWAHIQERNRRFISCGRCYTWLGEDLLKLKKRSFETFEQAVFPKAYQTLKDFCETTDGQELPSVLQRNFIIFGGFGTGKTHLLAATVNRLTAQLIPCRFMTGQGLFDALGKRMESHSGYADIIEEAAKIEVLAIDDIDKTYVSSRISDTETSFQVKTFFTILNRRYINELPTLVTTNAFDITPFVGGAALSRMNECSVFVDMEGKDYRQVLRKRMSNGKTTTTKH